MIKLFVIILLLFCHNSMALNLETKLENPALEARAGILFHELRCMVCAGESIADSRTELAKDLRQIVREEINNGKNDKEILQKIAANYGDKILMTPAFKPATYLLWLAPGLMLLFGAGIILKRLRTSI